MNTNELNAVNEVAETSAEELSMSATNSSNVLRKVGAIALVTGIVVGGVKLAKLGWDKVIKPGLAKRKAKKDVIDVEAVEVEETEETE